MPRSTRRALLRTSGALAATLAGCATLPGDDSGRTPDTQPPPGATAEPSTRTPGPVEPDHRAVRWAYDVAAGVRDPPAVAEGTVYVGGWRPTGGTPTPGHEPGPGESLFALDAADGTERWRHQLDAPVQATPTVGARAVHVVTGWYGTHGLGFAVTTVARDGTRRWRFAPRMPYKSFTVVGVAAGRVFVGTSDDAYAASGETLRALDATTGEESWTAETGDVGGGAARDDAVHVTAVGNLSSYDAASGRVRWQVPGRAFAEVTATPDAVYLADDAVRALAPDDGTDLWRFEPTGRLSATAVGDGVVYAGSDEGAVVALDAADGAERWRATVGGAARDLHPDGDAVYVGSDRAGAIALDAADGSERWRAARGVEAHVGPVVGDAVVVVGPDGGWLRSLAAADGAERWQLEPVGEPTRPVAAGGLVSVATDRGLVYGLAS